MRIKSSNTDAVLEMTTDRLGHVTLRALISSSAGSTADEWCVDTQLGLEAGALEAIAADAKRLWGK